MYKATKVPLKFHWSLHYPTKKSKPCFPSTALSSADARVLTTQSKLVFQELMVLKH